MKRGFALLALVLLVGCSSSPSVPWDHYAPGLKAEIDDMASSGDCSGLQRQFDAAFANDDAVRSRYGEGNADLMDYIDSKIKDSC